ncbi:HAD family hydrolase [Facklamia miroungae]|uniref:Soluble P-type ATPase n=1 Tax=Facklamia miroungae TaxID=120956 RepID=A0A1G7UNK0_9LACT|nr:HAD family hydrolase [Facklamia miroungae]NKZ30182.1 ATPase P [Facklamia miroungae]SDG49175.1 Soluble P-type ATPase [Facklamia miroungae]
MIKYQIPGNETIEISNLVIDFNGTIAEDGKLIEGVAELLINLSGKIKIYIATADTYGTVKTQCESLPVELATFPSNKAALSKKALVELLGSENCACIGNGYNDGEMMSLAALAIAVVGTEGLATACIRKADIVAPSIHSALGMLLKPDHIKATLRH